MSNVPSDLNHTSVFMFDADPVTTTAIITVQAYQATDAELWDLEERLRGSDYVVNRVGGPAEPMAAVNVIRPVDIYPIP